MRNAFIEELVVHASIHDNIALVVGDLGFSVVEPFADRFPERFINAGVAEQNMTGLAAGMASEGYHVFTYSIANFPTFRCAEQIRNDVAYHNLPVTIVAVGGGLAYGSMGYSHHAVQDYALMRSMPNMLIAAPGDPMEVRACMRYLIKNPQPSYLRLGKAGEPSFHADIPEVSPGQWLCVRQGSNQKTFLTTGATLELASYASAGVNDLADWAIHTLPLWGMENKISQSSQIMLFDEIVTVEDHLMDGGFGSWLLEALAVYNPPSLIKIRNKYLDQRVCGMVGKQAILNAEGGLVW